MAKTPLSQCRGPVLIPDQGSGSYLPWLEVQMPQLKDPMCHNQGPAQPNKKTLRKKKNEVESLKSGFQKNPQISKETVTKIGFLGNG